MKLRNEANSVAKPAEFVTKPFLVCLGALLTSFRLGGYRKLSATANMADYSSNTICDLPKVKRRDWPEMNIVTYTTREEYIF